MLHQFELFGSFFTLDVNSGSLHLTDKFGAEAIKLLNITAKRNVLGFYWIIIMEK